MRFLAPWRLVFLIAPLALVAGYLVVQRARPRYAARFSSVDLLASVAPRRPGWQRHVAPIALALAAFLLVGAYARPARASRVARQRGTVMLTLDISGSMAAQDVAPTRLLAAEASAHRFVDHLTPGIKLGLVAFDTTARVLVAPTTDRATVQAAIADLQAGTGTATGDAIQLALDAISTQPGDPSGKPTPAAVVLMSDGTPTVGRGDQSPADTVAQAVDAARSAHVPIDTIAFGTADGTVQVGRRIIPVPYDPQAMSDIARLSGGRTFIASSGDRLSSVYSQIGKLVGYDTVTKEITAGFTGLGIIILVAGAGAALWLTQRFP